MKRSTSPLSRDTPQPQIEHGPDSTLHHDSLFASYPLLRLSLHYPLADVSTPQVPTLAALPDLKLLREAHALKSIDPQSVLCQYEIGGGECRDANCEDVHLSKLGCADVEPDGA